MDQRENNGKIPGGYIMKKILKIICGILLVVIVAVGGLFTYLSLTEYRPEEETELTLSGTAVKSLKEGDPLRVLTWNIGYGALGDNADFFMDGGKMVNTADRGRVQENMSSLLADIQAQDADLILIQECDTDSSRSHHTNEMTYLSEGLPDMVYTFANNFKVAFLPYPIPPIGKVDSGLVTFSAYPVSQAKRQSLPVPFKWPIRMANLKRCLAVHRIPLENSEKELVLINLHLEAYDDGEGKVAQTKMLREVLQAEADAGNYVIAGGDFNQTFDDIDISRFPLQEGMWAPGIIADEDFGAGWQFCMDAEIPTCRSLDKPYRDADLEHFQYYVIDGFIVSDNIKIDSLRTLDLGFTASDHNPVLMEAVLVNGDGSF